MMASKLGRDEFTTMQNGSWLRLWIFQVPVYSGANFRPFKKLTTFSLLLKLGVTVSFGLLYIYVVGELLVFWLLCWEELLEC